jgi:hypothetical protein
MQVKNIIYPFHGLLDAKYYRQRLRRQSLENPSMLKIFHIARLPVLKLIYFSLPPAGIAPSIYDKIVSSLKSICVLPVYAARVSFRGFS